MRTHPTILATLFCIVGVLLFNGCSVDVLSVSPSSATPGQIIKLEVSRFSTKIDYSVKFNDVLVPPIGVGEDSITVMVPLVESGDYSVSVVAGKLVREGDKSSLFIEPTEPITGREADELFNNIGKVLEISQNDVLTDYEAIGGTSENLDSLKQGFENCFQILNSAQQELRNLSAEDKDALCQLIKGSNLGESFSKSLHILKSNPQDTYYQEILAKQRVSDLLSDTEFFLIATRLDLTSALLTDTRSVLKGLKYLSLLANFAPGFGQIVSAGAWGSLSVADQILKIIDGIIDGVLPTDLKQVYLEARPLTGEYLNPGELASIQMYGTFGSQKPWTEVAADFALDASVGVIVDGFDDEIRHFLDDIPGMDVDLRTTYAKDLLDEVAKSFFDAGFDIGDNIFNMPWEDVTSGGEYAWWEYDVPLSTDYYYFKPFMQVTNGFASFIPFWGDDLTSTLQDLMIDILGEDSLLTNRPVIVENETIVSKYDRDSGTVLAQNAGKTKIHASVYRFDQVADILWLFPIEGWVYLEEGDEIKTPDGTKVNVNTALEITVTDAYDPVYSDLVVSPVSGTVSEGFTTDGGSFKISVSPVDENGNLIYDNVSVEDFSFAPIQVANLSDPDTIVASGWAESDSVEMIRPGNPNAGVNVAILLDSSGSMSDNDRYLQRVDAAKSLIDTLSASDSAAILDFGAGYTDDFYETRLLQDFTSDRDLLYYAIDQVTDSGGTPMYTSIDETLAYMGSRGLFNPALVVLTDGEAGDDEYFDDVVSRSQALNIPVFAVGLGNDLDFTQLQALAAETGGTFSSVADAAGLQNLFESLGIAVSAGRIIVHASGAFVPALQHTGEYILYGELRTKISGLTIPTPFEFIVDVLSVEEGSMLKNLDNAYK